MPVIINLRYKIIKADAVAEFLFPAVFFCLFQSAVCICNRRDATFFIAENIASRIVTAFAKKIFTCIKAVRTEAYGEPWKFFLKPLHQPVFIPDPRSCKRTAAHQPMHKLADHILQLPRVQPFQICMFLGGRNHARKERIRKGVHSFTKGQLEKYEKRFDTVIAGGREQNKKTKGRIQKRRKGTVEPTGKI